MLWEIEIRPRGRDAERDRVCDEFDLLTHSRRGGDLISGSARGFLLEGDLGEAAVRRLQDELLVDRIVEIGLFSKLGEHRVPALTVLLKPGVMDPVAESVLKAAISARRSTPCEPFAVISVQKRSHRVTATRSSVKCWPTMLSSGSSSARCGRSTSHLGSHMRSRKSPYRCSGSTMPDCSS
jgi:hypothetical protein